MTSATRDEEIGLPVAHPPPSPPVPIYPLLKCSIHTGPITGTKRARALAELERFQGALPNASVLNPCKISGENNGTHRCFRRENAGAFASEKARREYSENKPRDPPCSSNMKATPYESSHTPSSPLAEEFPSTPELFCRRFGGSIVASAVGGVSTSAALYPEEARSADANVSLRRHSDASVVSPFYNPTRPSAPAWRFGETSNRCSGSEGGTLCNSVGSRGGSFVDGPRGLPWASSGCARKLTQTAFMLPAPKTKNATGLARRGC